MFACLGCCVVIIGGLYLLIDKVFLAGLGGVKGLVAEMGPDEETYPVPGEASRFRPIDALAEIRQKAGKEARLTQLRIDFIKSDATVDLTAEYKPGPSVTYTFIRPSASPPKNLPPVGAGRAPDDIWIEEVEARCYLPGQMSLITKTGGAINKRYQLVNKGYVVKVGSPRMGKLPEELALTKVSIEAMWAAAIAKGAPKAAVARIEYEVDESSFSIDKTNVRLRWDANGALKD
jgi:hypothetical protein